MSGLTVVDIAVTWCKGEGAAPAAVAVGDGSAILCGDGITVRGREAAEGRGDVGGLCASITEPVVARQEGHADARGGRATQGKADRSCGLDLIHLSGDNRSQRAVPSVVLIAGEAGILRIDEDGVAAEGGFQLL